MRGFRDNKVLLLARYDVIVISPLGALPEIFMTDSERATMTYWERSIPTFYLGCMVSEITRFYCKPDMTSPSFLRQGLLPANFRDGIWKSDHDFLIAFNTNLWVGCMVSEITRFHCNPIWRHRDFYARGCFRQFFMTDSEKATMTSWWRSVKNVYLGCMVSEITRFYCQLKMTSSWFLR